MKKNIIRILCFVFLFVFIISCSSQRSSVLDDKKMTIIKDYSYIKWFTGSDLNPFEPNNIELEKVNRIFEKAINEGKFHFLKKEKISELKKHYRQYLCYLNEKGEKIIYINAFCELFDEYDEENNLVPFDWKNKMVDVADGGKCYWNIKINLTTNEYFELKVNGIS